MLRRTFLATAAASVAAPALAQGAAKTLRVIPGAALTALDPIWTTAPQTKNHGYLVYDQIASVDGNYVPRPQMAEGWVVDDDARSWTFTLRPGLKFHDNEPVRAADCIQSIKRWQMRDGFGQALAAATDELNALDDRRFKFRLKKPFPLLAAALGKSNSSQCFIMPERIAKTDPMQAIKDATGSGPFRFLPSEWNVGARAAYAKFEGYVPRDEPLSGIAGGRVAKVDRLEYTVMPDGATASAAMRAGEQDYWEQPLLDLVGQMRRDRNLVVETRDPTGTYMMLRFNQLQPPFNNPALRRAVAMAVDQADYMRAIAGTDPKAWGACYGFFACGTPLETEAGGDFMRTPDLAKARAAVQASGYDGKKAVMIVATDNAAINAVSEVSADLLRKIGMEVEYVATDWGTMLQRRNSQEPIERGGWSVFHTVWNGADILNPAVNTMIRASGRRAWFGWPDDPEIEKLRGAYFDSAEPGGAQQVVEAISKRAFETLPYVPLGYYVQPHAWRRNITGVSPAPTTIYWGIGKDG
jgi:peptide/nickel transport system substrate-binding protein